MKIIPAILPKKFSEIEEKIELLAGFVSNVQVDICDGKFVPTITWPNWKTDENFEAILREERGMPEWESFDYEFDLMVSEPGPEEVKKWLMAGASRIVLHLASSKDLNPALDTLQNLVEVGIAIQPTTSLEELKPYIEKINYIQIMGIRKAGFQGQPFEMQTLEKIKEVKAAFPNLLIQIDGGVSLENADLLKEAGADRLVVGSALFESDNIVDTFEEMTRL